MNNSLERGCRLITLVAAFAIHPQRGEGGGDDSACSPPNPFLHCWCFSSSTYKDHLWDEKESLFQVCTQSSFWALSLTFFGLLMVCCHVFAFVERVTLLYVLDQKAETLHMKGRRKTSMAPSSQSWWLWNLLPNTKWAIAPSHMVPLCLNRVGFDYCD